MARIPDAVVEQLKQSISVQRLAEARGIELKRHGADLIGRCPFHADKTPSLVITPAKNLWHCLGACQAGGTVIDWVMKAEGVSFRHAVELLQNDYQPLAAASSSLPTKHSTVPKLPAPVQFDADDRALLLQVIEYYHQTLLQSPEALEYLKKRAIGSEDAIRHFKLGFANRTLGLRLPESNRLAGSEIRTRLQTLGLLRDSGHEHFNGSLVVPILDAEGNVTEVYGRKITEQLRRGTPLHLYLPGPHRGVFNAAALHTAKEIILCEALIDALTFWCAGYRNVTAAYGVEGFTADHLALFKQCSVERVLIAYDRDEAGDRAAEKLSKELLAAGLDCYRILFPKGMDANEYALKVTPADKSLGLAIRKAQWLGAAQGRANGVEGRMPRAAKGQAKEITTVATPPLAVEAVNDTSARAASLPLVASVAATEILPEITEPSLPPLPAQVVPDAPCAAPTSVDAQSTDHEHVVTVGDRRYRVRGLTKNLAFDVMLKVNVLVARGEVFHVDTLDLYSVRARTAFITQAAAELSVKDDVIRHDLGNVLRMLEQLQEKTIEKTLAAFGAGVRLFGYWISCECAIRAGESDCLAA
jgi:DNA primase